MFRTQLPRIYELRDLIADPCSPEAYFRNLDTLLQDSSHVMYVYVCWEETLQGLNPEAWGFLKGDASPYLTRKDPNGRGWQQLFDILSQAYAFNYLRRYGYSSVRFIPRSRKRGQKTPDLEAVLGSETILCEVKSINISNYELRSRKDSTARSIKVQLDSGFFEKLASSITQAKGQMEAYDPAGKMRQIVYINVYFDDFLGEYKVQHFCQIDQYLLDNPISGIDLVFHNDRTPFYAPISMKSATIDNQSY